MNDYEQLAVSTINKRMSNFENGKYEDKQDLDRSTLVLAEQIKMIHEVNLINTIMANKYLSDLQKKYAKLLQTEQFKEYREQVINFNDDFITDRERLFNIRKTEADNNKMSMDAWKQAMKEDKHGNGSSNGGSEIEEPISEKKQEEPEQEQGSYGK